MKGKHLTLIIYIVLLGTSLLLADFNDETNLFTVGSQFILAITISFITLMVILIIIFLILHISEKWNSNVFKN